MENVDKEILVNINCPLKLILNYIRNVVGLDDTSELYPNIFLLIFLINILKYVFLAEFDLCDEINCQLRKLSFFQPHTSGFDIFQADLTYTIITFERKF